MNDKKTIVTSYFTFLQQALYFNLIESAKMRSDYKYKNSRIDQLNKFI